MAHTVKEGDARVLRWNLGRDLTGIDTARVIMSIRPGDTPALNRDGVIDSPPTAGIVSLAIDTDDFSSNGLSVHGRDHMDYLVEIELLPGPHTHPDDGYETLTVLPDLG